ncbi:MAG: PQQ-binding-like beta-propeller repeat protein [Candidatus Riflebacteria bacterium]|nr:PQQ-binding-like beta-propeller repeat protein [Candidatus Riflebacteria bacterium]
MSKRILGALLVIASIAAFHLLGSQSETPAVWHGSVNAKVFSDPVSVADRCIFLGGDKGKRFFKLFEVDADGKVTAESVQMNIFPFSPVVSGNMVILADSARMVRGFSVPGLKLEWESGTLEQFKVPPVTIDNNRFIVQSTANALFCLDSKTGKPIWDKVFTDTLVNYAAGKVIICIHGFNDLKKPKWRASALSSEDGSLLWTSDAILSQDTPLFVQNVCVLSSNEGEILIFDQESGIQLFKNQVKGLKAAQILDETLIMLASGGSRIVCMSLMTGNSWSTTMQSGFMGAAKYGERLLLLDKKNLRCVEVSSGAQIWRKELDDVYNGFPFRKGIFITHKDSFFSRNTFGSYIETGSSHSTWMATGRSLFMRPMVVDNGDFLLSYDGTFRLMPKPSTGGAVIESTVPAQISDPTAANIKFWKDEVATGTNASGGVAVSTPDETPSDNGTLTPKSPAINPRPTVEGSSENLLDDGWQKAD